MTVIFFENVVIVTEIHWDPHNFDPVQEPLLLGKNLSDRS